MEDCLPERDANLSGVSLRNANLSVANLNSTDLRGANVENAQFGWNIWLSEDMKFDLEQRGQSEQRRAICDDLRVLLFDFGSWLD